MKLILLSLLLFCSITAFAQPGETSLNDTRIPRVGRAITQANPDGTLNVRVNVSGTVVNFTVRPNGVTSVNGKTTTTGIVSLSAVDIPGISEVGKTGAYTDITGRPTDLSAFTNNPGFQKAADVTSAIAGKANLISSLFLVKVGTISEVAGVVVPAGDTYLIQVANDTSQDPPYNQFQFYLKNESGISKIGLIKQ